MKPYLDFDWSFLDSRDDKDKDNDKDNNKD